MTTETIESLKRLLSTVSRVATRIAYSDLIVPELRNDLLELSNRSVELHITLDNEIKS